jgi:hypothetical protein
MILTIGAKKYLSLYNAIYILMRLQRVQVKYNLCQQYVAKGAYMIADHTVEAHCSLHISLHETAETSMNTIQFI